MTQHGVYKHIGQVLGLHVEMIYLWINVMIHVYKHCAILMTAQMPAHTNLLMLAELLYLSKEIIKNYENRSLPLPTPRGIAPFGYWLVDGTYTVTAQIYRIEDQLLPRSVNLCTTSIGSSIYSIQLYMYNTFQKSLMSDNSLIFSALFLQAYM